jgi:glycosyltransferase involved in cell wall biosynthesis
MKTLFLASDLAAPGQGMQLASLAAASKSAGNETRVISLGKTPGEPGAFLEANGIKAECLGARSWLLPVGLLRGALKVLLFRPDILQTWGFSANISGKAIGFFCGAKATISSLRSPDTPKRLEAERISSFLCARTVASSKWLGELAKACRISRDGSETVIPNSCDASAFKFKERRPPPKDKRWKILYLGKRCPETGLPELLHALGALTRAGLKLKAVFAGEAAPGFDAGISTLVKDLGLETNLELKGPLKREETARLFENAHLLVAPNVFDWTPNTIMEAFASGLPVVATGIEGVGELVVDGRTGRLAVPMEPASLARKIADALGDYDSSMRMAREAAKLLRERHSPAAVNAAYLKLYDEILKQIEAVETPKPEKN